MSVLPILARYALTAGSAEFVSMAWWGTGIVILLVLIVDLGFSRTVSQLVIKRQLPGNLSVGVANAAAVIIENPYKRQVLCTVADQLAEGFATDNLPVTVSLKPGHKRIIHYHLFPNLRGLFPLGSIDIRITSVLKLWEFRQQACDDQTVRVYPNFKPVLDNKILSMEQQLTQMGAHVVQRRGQGLDFHQLREFQQGDVLRQVDWRASARQAKLISREYQSEKDQDVIFLLDCGRRMRIKEDDLSHFDHALNAMLVTAWMALRQGDAVGMMSVAGADRWVSPVKGRAAMKLLLNQVYDLHSTTENSDYLRAAEQLMTRHRKHALVILITNVRDEGAEDLQAAIRLLSGSHQVMVASLREVQLDQLLSQSVQSFDQALAVCGIARYLQERQQALRQLGSTGTTLADVLPAALPVALVNGYLSIKASGAL
ncbi:DUF58 domain-containing protein [Kistimonas asteriae]|uniref:DUF58 domain-containing protein n=1 Tax=Kistimonas asteriae TaxID=517724 RepID=UPI001BACF0B0|nr:DUF58 domain-containing protein [Kistimonas asteriae]